MSEVLSLLQILSLALTSLENARVDVGQYMVLRAKAQAEGRQLSVDELKALADTAQTAIDAIPTGDAVVKALEDQAPDAI